MSFLDNLQKFTNSPQGMAMASALLSNSGYSKRPITLGEAMGQGLLGMGQEDQREFENKHKGSLLDLNRQGLDIKREGMENQKLSTQAYIDNMRQQRGMDYQKLKMMMDDRNRQRQAMSNIQNLIGSPETYAEAPIPLMNAGEQVPQGTGAGLLGGQMNQDEFRQQAARELLATGDYQSALGLLAPPKKGGFGQPREFIGADGKPMLVQVNSEGEVRPLAGYQGMPKKGFEVTTPDGTKVSLGGSSGIGTAAKNSAEKGIMKAESLRKNIKESMKNYNPDYLTAQGKVKDAFIDAKDFLNLPLSKKEKEFGGNQVNFEHMVGRGFHEYMQLMVGARPAFKLYEHMLKSYPNMKLRPNKFESAMKSIDQSLKDTIELNRKYLKEGLSEDAAWEKAGKNLDKGFEKVFGDLVENGDEILKEYKTENDPLGIRK